MKKTDWGMEIIRVTDGYKIRYTLDEADAIDETVIQDTDDKLKSGEELLWFVIDQFNFGESKYDDWRLQVCRENNNGTLVFQGDTYSLRGEE